jgi:hypothetical protein
MNMLMPMPMPTGMVDNLSKYAAINLIIQERQ